MESPEIIGGPVGSQHPVMEQTRRSVIQARSESFQVQSDLNQSDDDNPLHIHVPKMGKNLIKHAESKEGILTDVYLLKMARNEEKELIWRQIYLHKKFNKGITRVQSSEANANRPSVIVRHKSRCGKEDLDRYLNLDFTDASSSTEPSLLEAGIDIEEIRDFNFQEKITDMYNLYFVDEMPYAHCIGMVRNSFFATWRTLPLGERVMADCIKFCQDKTATLPDYWMDMALKQTRCTSCTSCSIACSFSQEPLHFGPVKHGDDGRYSRQHPLSGVEQQNSPDQPDALDQPSQRKGRQRSTQLRARRRRLEAMEGIHGAF